MPSVVASVEMVVTFLSCSHQTPTLLRRPEFSIHCLALNRIASVLHILSAGLKRRASADSVGLESPKSEVI